MLLTLAVKVSISSCHIEIEKKDLLNFSFTSITRNKNARGGLKTKSDRGGG
jgi:hypothetical protein